MKTLLHSIISLFRHGLELVPFCPSRGVLNCIVPGYSIPSLDKPASEQIDNLDRRQVAILFADVAYYSRLTEQDEIGTHCRLLESMKFVRAEIAAQGGRVAHFAGDAVLAEFRDPDSALHCAVNVQLAARQWNANLPINRQLMFRIGVNFGEVIADQGDIYGNAVNLTERLEKLAGRGGICVSESIRSQLLEHPAYEFISMGKQYVRNIDEPVNAFWIEMDEAACGDFGRTGAVRVSSVAS